MGELAKQFGVGENEVKKLVASGQVGFPAIEQAFISLTSQGGKFAGMMDAQSKTTTGLFSTLKDTINEVFLTLGEPINDAIRPLISEAIGLVSKLTPLGVPTNYTASTYFKIEWDEVFFPEDNEIPSSLVAARSWEWNGTDEFSDWFEIPTPTTAGEIHIRNLRATSYRSPWGTKPRHTGDRWQAPPSS